MLLSSSFDSTNMLQMSQKVIRLIYLISLLALTRAKEHLRPRAEDAEMLKELEQLNQAKRRRSQRGLVKEGDSLVDTYFPELVITDPDVGCHGILFSNDIVVTSKWNYHLGDMAKQAALTKLLAKLWIVQVVLAQHTPTCELGSGMQVHSRLQQAKLLHFIHVTAPMTSKEMISQL